MRDLMRGFAAGHDAWLRQNRTTDPACRGAAWVRPVTTLDVAARFYAIAVLGGQGGAVGDIAGAQPPAGALAHARGADAQALVKAVRARTADADMGSNAVAFSGAATANGRGLLLGNPHHPWQGGRRFWQAQQTIPGELNVASASLLGRPTISIGYNAYVAWSHTVSTGVPYNPTRLTPDPLDPTVYRVDGRPERMTRRSVTVPIEHGAPVTRTQWWTRYGPVVTDSGNGGPPLPWTTTTAYALSDPTAEPEPPAPKPDRVPTYAADPGDQDAVLDEFLAAHDEFEKWRTFSGDTTHAIHESQTLRIERVHESRPRETAWTVAGYKTPVSDRMWHLPMTGASPAPIVKALPTVLASGDAWDTDGSPVTEESVVEVTRPLADVGWNPKAPGRYLHWRPEREIHWLPCSPRPITPPPCRCAGSAGPI